MKNDHIWVVEKVSNSSGQFKPINRTGYQTRRDARYAVRFLTDCREHPYHYYRVAKYIREDAKTSQQIE